MKNFKNKRTKIKKKKGDKAKIEVAEACDKNVKLGKGDAGETNWWRIFREVVEKLKATFEH